MTSLLSLIQDITTDTKAGKNIEPSSLGNTSFKPAPHTNFNLTVKNKGLLAIFGSTSILKLPDVDTFFIPDQFNNSIVIEDRIRNKLSLLEADRLSLNIMQEYEERMKNYLAGEGAVFFSTDEHDI